MANASGKITDISPGCGGPSVVNPRAVVSFAVVTGGSTDVNLRFTEEGEPRMTEEGDTRFID